MGSTFRGGSEAPRRPAGKDIDVLGPSDSSDSGSDVQNEHAMSTGGDSPDEWGAVPAAAGSDSDAAGTGERAEAAGTSVEDGADIMADRIFTPSTADRDPSDRPKSDEAAERADDELDPDDESAT